MAEPAFVLLGPPASGKGTQGRLLAERAGLSYFSTGKQLRREMEAGSEFGRQAEPFLAAGNYVPDELALAIALAWLQQVDGGWVLDGFPRTVVQARELDNLLGDERHNLRALLLVVPEEELERRVGARRECADCSWTGTIALAGEAGACPACGGELTQRRDDALENFRMRLKAFDELTAPVAHYFEASSRLRRVSGVGDPEEVFQHLQSALEDS